MDFPFLQRILNSLRHARTRTHAHDTACTECSAMDQLMFDVGLAATNLFRALP